MYRARQYQVRRVVVSMMLFVAGVGAGLCLHGPVPVTPPVEHGAPVIDSFAPPAHPPADLPAGEPHAADVAALWLGLPGPPPLEREALEQAFAPAEQQRGGDIIVTRVLAAFAPEAATGP